MNDPSTTLDEIDRALMAGSKIRAAKQYREATGVPIKAAYEFVQRRAKEIGAPSQSVHPLAFRYVVGMIVLGLLVLVAGPNILRTLHLMRFLPLSFAVGTAVLIGLELRMLRVGIMKWRDALLPWIGPVAILVFQNVKQPH